MKNLIFTIGQTYQLNFYGKETLEFTGTFKGYDFTGDIPVYAFQDTQSGQIRGIEHQMIDQVQYGWSIRPIAPVQPSQSVIKIGKGLTVDASGIHLNAVILNDQQYKNLVQAIYKQLIDLADMDLGDMGHCMDAAEGIVNTWMSENQIIHEF